MGIDLQAMASSFRERQGELLPTATLRFDRDPQLFSMLSKDSLPVDLKVGCYEEEGLVFKQEDRYGQPLTFITSSHVARLEIPEGLSPWNNAVLVFLKALPEGVKIVLYWC